MNVSRSFGIAALFTTLALLACDPGQAPASSDDRGTWQPSGKADSMDSCEGSCDDMAPSGCWCDPTCHEFGDCCPDVEAVCESTCPDLTPPSEDFCPNGDVVAEVEQGTGCTIGYSCADACPNLTPPGPGFCPEGEIVAELDEDTGCVVGFECDPCPLVTPPSPDFCPDGELTANVDDAGCVVGFECGE